MAIFDFLNGISPWYWVAFALALGALELATFSLFLLWPACAALVMAVLLFASPGISASVQLVIFAVLSVFMMFVGRYFFAANLLGKDDQASDLNNRATRIVGRSGVVLTTNGDQGAIEVDGIRWQARWDAGSVREVGDRVQVVSADGMILTVTPVAQ